MKLVLKDYILSLKEDGELDTLLTNLLWNLNCNNLTKPKKGRQHGVDIAAFGKDLEDAGKEKVFLIAVKQGDFARSNWDVGVNSIRPTLGEILNTYLPISVSTKYQKFPKKIIVACNGYLNQNVNMDWVQFIKAHSENEKIEFEFWGIEKIVMLVEKHLLSTMMFPDEYQLLLRKTLSFLDLPDYDLRHFYQLNDHLFNKNLTAKNNRELIKSLRLVRLTSNILFKWCIEMNNLKPALIASERVLLMYWDWIRKRNLFEENEPLKELMNYHLFKIQINRYYFAKIQDSFYSKDGLSFGIRNPIEYSLITYEQIGISATIGLTELYEASAHIGSSIDIESDYSNTCYKNARQVSLSLGNLIVNNPAAFNPKYDEHCIEINLAMILFYQTESYDFAIHWLGNLIINLRDNYAINGFIPLFVTNYDKLVQIEIRKDKEEISSSILITCLAEWCIMLKQDKLYLMLRELVEKSFPEIDLQLWHPEENTEGNLYNSNAMSETGSTRSTIKLPINPLEYEMEMAEELKIFFDETKMQHNIIGFPYIEYLANRHFRSYVFPNSWRQLLSTRFCFNKKN